MNKLTKTGARRLLKLASQIARRRKYDQRMFAHSCGTPACAWGTHVVNTPRLLNKAVKAYPGDLDTAILYHLNPFNDGLAAKEFSISNGDAAELFGDMGCGNAGTNAKNAATYIRAFVKRKGVV